MSFYLMYGYFVYRYTVYYYLIYKAQNKFIHPLNKSKLPDRSWWNLAWKFILMAGRFLAGFHRISQPMGSGWP